MHEAFAYVVQGSLASEPEPSLSGALPSTMQPNMTPRMEHRLPSSFDIADTPPPDTSGAPRTPKSKRRLSEGADTPTVLALDAQCVMQVSCVSSVVQYALRECMLSSRDDLRCRLVSTQVTV